MKLPRLLIKFGIGFENKRIRFGKDGLRNGLDRRFVQLCGHDLLPNVFEMSDNPKGRKP